MKRCLTLLLAVLGMLLPGLLPGGEARAQGRAVDSLRRLLEAQPRPDSTRVRRLQALGWQLMQRDVPQAIALTEQSLGLARQVRDTAGEARALIRLGTLHRLQAGYGRAWHYAQLARQFAERRPGHPGLGTAYLQLSLIALEQGQPATALPLALQGLRLAEQTRDLRTQMYLRVTMAGIYVQTEDFRNALAMLQAGIASAEQLGDQPAVASALNLLGNAYRLQKNWVAAQGYFLRSARLNHRLGDARSETIDQTSLANLYELQGRHAQALAHGWQARALARANQDTFNLPATELALARTYLATQEPDSAIALAKHGLHLSQQRRNNENIRTAGSILAQAYAARGDFAHAYRYHQLYAAYQDTLSGAETQRKTSAVRHGYELGKQQDQIALLKKDQEIAAQRSVRQRLQVYGLLAGVLALVLLTALLWRNVRLKQRANRRLGEKNVEIAAHRDDLDRTLTELQTTQNQLVQREKMASLGELTAGVAHEMQNPLNFVTNFADLSVELVAELEAELAKESLSAAGRPAIGALVQALAQNQAKIHQHGHRADRIVKNMLEHARTRSGERQPTDLNALADEYLRLAYHGWRAKNKDFNAELKTDFDPRLGLVPVVPQDLSRVLLNLLTNAFYAVAEKAKTAGPAYRPQVAVATRRTGGTVYIRVRDNGNGIPAAVIEKVCQPFFTTKPTGEGTGLGLSLSYDIITKGHDGTLNIESREGECTEVVLSLPGAAEGARTAARVSK